MPNTERHIEFTELSLDEGWVRSLSYPSGVLVHERTLVGSLDETRRTGRRTRLLRFAPGQFTAEPVVHDFWEEIYLLEGVLVVGADASGVGGERFAAPTHAHRPPGILHGPFGSDDGCTMLELTWYE